MSGKIRKYTDEFKKQIVNLRNTGKTVQSIHEEYKISKSTINKWVGDHENSGSFKAKDNRSIENVELLSLKKEIKQLKTEAGRKAALYCSPCNLNDTSLR